MKPCCSFCKSDGILPVAHLRGCARAHEHQLAVSPALGSTSCRARASASLPPCRFEAEVAWLSYIATTPLLLHGIFGSPNSLYRILLLTVRIARYVFQLEAQQKNKTYIYIYMCIHSGVIQNARSVGHCHIYDTKGLWQMR